MDVLDGIDRALIGLLRKNARIAVSDLAKQIGVSRATVQNRMKRLEQQGHISGYTAIVSPKVDQQMSAVRAIMNIEMEGNSSRAIRSMLMSEPSTVAIHSTNGHWDLIVELHTRSLEDFDRVISRIRGSKYIVSSETNILLSTQKMSLGDVK